MNKVGVHLVRAGLIASLILGMTTIEVITYAGDWMAGRGYGISC